MNARSRQTAFAAVLALLAAGLTMPMAAQAHGRGDGDGYRHSERYDDDGGWHHDRGWHRGWYKHHRAYYGPRYYYYPDTVIYTPAPRAYYYPAEPVYSYPQEYGSVGIHLDYNLLY